VQEKHNDDNQQDHTHDQQRGCPDWFWEKPSDDVVSNPRDATNNDDIEQDSKKRLYAHKAPFI